VGFLSSSVFSPPARPPSCGRMETDVLIGWVETVAVLIWFQKRGSNRLDPFPGTAISKLLLPAVSRSAAAAGAVLPRLTLIHGQAAPFVLGTIKSFYGLFSLLLSTHFNETEAPCLYQLSPWPIPQSRETGRAPKVVHLSQNKTGRLHRVFCSCSPPREYHYHRVCYEPFKEQNIRYNTQGASIWSVSPSGTIRKI
jgi:hypothetical protein